MSNPDQANQYTRIYYSKHNKIVYLLPIDYVKSLLKKGFSLENIGERIMQFEKSKNQGIECPNIKRTILFYVQSQSEEINGVVPY